MVTELAHASHPHAACQLVKATGRQGHSIHQILLRSSFSDKFPKNYRTGCLDTRRVLDSQPRHSESISTRFWWRRKNALLADKFRPTHADQNWKSEESGITCVTVRSTADVSFPVTR